MPHRRRERRRLQRLLAKQPEKLAKQTAMQGGIQILRRIIGLGFILAGISLMDTRFWWGYGLAVVGFVLLILEVCVEPELLKRPVWIQVALLAACFAGFDILTITLISPYAPVGVISYSPRNGEYKLGTEFAGIEWDSHLADLRVSLTNPNYADYEKVDFAIYPDAWTHKAAILNASQGCELMALPRDKLSVSMNMKGGATRITSTNLGGDTDIHDNSGDIFTTLATDGGYRLRCETFFSHSTIQIVFALVTLPSFIDTKPPPPGKKKLETVEIAGAKSAFEVLGDKPNPKNVRVEGHFKKNKQPFSFKCATRVLDGS
jgi:hypothetical protein